MAPWRALTTSSSTPRLCSRPPLQSATAATTPSLPPCAGTPSQWTTLRTRATATRGPPWRRARGPPSTWRAWRQTRQRGCTAGTRTACGVTGGPATSCSGFEPPWSFARRARPKHRSAVTLQRRQCVSAAHSSSLRAVSPGLSRLSPSGPTTKNTGLYFYSLRRSAPLPVRSAPFRPRRTDHVDLSIKAPAECVFCKLPSSSPATPLCGHSHCKPCILQWLARPGQRPRCPQCSEGGAPLAPPGVSSTAHNAAGGEAAAAAGAGAASAAEGGAAPAPAGAQRFASRAAANARAASTRAGYHYPCVAVSRAKFDAFAKDPDGLMVYPTHIVVQLGESYVTVGDVWHEVGFCNGGKVDVPPAYFDAEEKVVWLWLLNKERNGTYNNNGTMARIDFKLLRPTAVLTPTFTERNCGYYPVFSSVQGDALTVDHFAYEGYRHARSTLAQGKWTTEYLGSLSPEAAVGLHRYDQGRLQALQRVCGITYHIKW